MTLEQTNTVDFAHFDVETGTLVLTLTDAWGWSAEEEHQHLHLLQSKLNAYIASIETGEARAFLAEKFRLLVHPSAPVRISLRTLNEPSATARRFLAVVEQTLREAGIGFEHRVGRPVEESSS